MSVQVPETFESTAILAENFCTGVQDGHAEHSRDSTTGLNKTWHLLVKSIPTDAVNCIMVRFFWSDGFLTAEDAKLERLKVAIVFTIADMFWVKKQDKCMLSMDTKN